MVADSPRIRGDDPAKKVAKPGQMYILPVFAGMILSTISLASAILHSPRIRGDDPYYAQDDPQAD